MNEREARRIVATYIGLWKRVEYEDKLTRVLIFL